MRALLTALSLSLAAMPAAAQQDPFVGTFSNGQLTLQLQAVEGGYAGVAMLNGSRFEVAAQRTGNILNGLYTYHGQAVPWVAAFQGSMLILQVDGETLFLQRLPEGATQPTPSQPQPGVVPAAPTGRLSAEAQEWHDWFLGKRLTQMNTYTSEDATGYAGSSSRSDWDLCSDSRFFYSGSSEVSVDVGGVSGSSGGPEQGAGQWRIIEQGGLIGIELHWSNGQVTQHQLDYENEETYMDGERTFVTERNTNCR